MHQLPNNYLLDLILHTCTFSAINRKLQRKGNREQPIVAKGNNCIASNPTVLVNK